MFHRVSLSKDKLHVKEVSSSADLPSGRSSSWCRVVNPSEAELDLLVSFLGLDDEDKEDIQFFLKEGARSRVEKGDLLMIVYSVPVIVDGEAETEQIMIFAKRSLAVTIEAKKSHVCQKFFDLALKNKGRYLFKRNAGFFVTELIDETNTRFLRHVNRIEASIDLIESQSGLLTNEQVNAISSANSTLSFFNQSTLANIEVLNSLRKTHHESLTKENREEFQDIYYDALQILDALKLQREMIMNIFNIQSILSNNQMNAFMKKLTALALIIMIPTLISGIYGMNVAGLPFAGGPEAFWIVIGVMLLITGTLYAVFRRADWL